MLAGNVYDMEQLDPKKLFLVFYPEDTPLRRLLKHHSEQVCQKSLELLERSRLPLDASLVEAGALLHDIGVGQCHAPSILCQGTEHYLRHGLLGAQMLRKYGRENGCLTIMEPLARICERHTGAGLDREEILRQNLPLLPRDFLPLTPEEKLVCLADKFFSKSGNMEEKSLDRILHGLEKFGPKTLERFHDMCRLFRVEG